MGKMHLRKTNLLYSHPSSVGDPVFQSIHQYLYDFFLNIANTLHLARTFYKKEQIDGFRRMFIYHFQISSHLLVFIKQHKVV